MTVIQKEPENENSIKTVDQDKKYCLKKKKISQRLRPRD